MFDWFGIVFAGMPQVAEIDMVDNQNVSPRIEKIKYKRALLSA